MMSVTLHISPDLESALRREAAKQGLDAEGFVVRTLRDRLTPNDPGSSPTGDAEADLIREINLGLPSETWQRYTALKSKRNDGSLSSDEQIELIEISDQVEAMNVRRMHHVIELARRRNQSVDALMDQLGIKSPLYE